MPTLMTPKSAVTVSNMATILRPSANDLTAEVATQSKEFREKLNFEILMMILCNRLHHAGTSLEPLKTGTGRDESFLATFAPLPKSARPGIAGLELSWPSRCRK